MNDMKESPVFVKTFELLAWLIPLTAKFPREQRFVVAAALQRAAFATQEALVRASQSAMPAEALGHLSEAATQLVLLRFSLRLSERMSLISTRRYEYAIERLGEIGRLVRAWQRSCQEDRSISSIS
jgi:hypothetical protein